MKILITGNQGYVGSVLGDYLEKFGFDAIGLDVGYYKECLLDENFVDIPTIAMDIRDVTATQLSGIDCVIHLAGLSNDPVGELDENLTYEINYEASVKLANLAESSGVKRFIYASTQSIYGFSNSEIELSEDESKKNPQTAYAKSKWMAEKEILAMANSKFTSLAIRPSTVFGWSPRLRTDIVFNNLLTNGMISGSIEVHSDGTPWRPILHVKDLAEMIRVSMLAPKEKVSGQAFNVGLIGGNYSVKEIAEFASDCITPKLPIIFNTENITDSRSYRVSFEKAKNMLGFAAQIGLLEGGSEIVNKLSALNIINNELNGKQTTRITQLNFLIQENLIDSNLRVK
jgi:nucleoside-diphosphate-sugar epimerase